MDKTKFRACQGCPLAASPAVSPRGPRNPKILLVGDPPSAASMGIERRGQLTDKQQALLDESFRRIGMGFRRHAFYIPCIRCPYDPDYFQSSDQKQITTNCGRHLERVIRKLDPEIIVPMGAMAAKMVMGRAVAITKARGIPVKRKSDDRWVFPMLGIYQISFRPQNRPIWDADFRGLKTFIESDYDPERVTQDRVGNYRVVTDLQYLVDNPPEVLSFDLETIGTRWYEPPDPEKEHPGAKIVLLQFATQPGEAQVLFWDHSQIKMPYRQRPRILRQLRQILCNPCTQVIGHNLAFDKTWVKHHFGFEFRIAHDTVMLSAILDENYPKDLSNVTKRYVPEMAGYDDAFNEGTDKSRMDLVNPDDLVIYGGGDVDAVLRLHQLLLPRVRADPKLYEHYKYVSIPGVNALSNVQRRGMNVNEEALDALEEVMATQVEEQRLSLLDRVDPQILLTHEEKGLRFTRDVLVRDILYDHPRGFQLTPVVFTKTTAKLAPELQKGSVSSKEALPYYFNEPNGVGTWAMELAQHVKDNRLLGTNVRKFRTNYVRGGKVYPCYFLHITDTGRSSSSDPNGQNFPKRGEAAKAYRRVFVPVNDEWFVCAPDLSQAELRISADTANEPVMLNIYQNNGDIHRSTAQVVMGTDEAGFSRLPDEEQDLARFKAKAVNFGFIYGMWWRGFVAYAKTQYGVDFTDNEAKELRRAFFRKYAGLLPWHDATRRFVQQHGYVRSYSGRLRHLPNVTSPEESLRADAERQAINAPVQEFASSLGVMALSALDQEIDRDYLKVIGFIHDSIVCLVRKEYVEWGLLMIQHYMENVPIEQNFGRRLRCPIQADLEFGLNLKDTVSPSVILDNNGRRCLDLERAREKMDIPPQLIPPNNGRVEVPNHLLLNHL